MAEWPIPAEVPLKNAHLRFGTLRYTRRTHDTTIDVRVHLDRLILEQRQDGSALAHLVSLVGNDADIGGVWAAILDGRTFWLSPPGLGELSATVGDNPQCWRRSILVPGGPRAFRHFCAVSLQLARPAPREGKSARRAILCDVHPPCVHLH